MKLKLDKIRWEIINHPAKYKILSCGRRWGKSTLSAIFLLHQKLQAGERRMYLSPYHSQTKSIMFPVMKNLLSQNSDVKINETELSFTFSNNAQILLKGADNANSLRGISLGYDGSNAVVLDECAYIKENVFTEIVMPMLFDHNAKALLCSTPASFNHFYNLYMTGQGQDPNYKSWQFSTLDKGMISKEAVADAKRTMTADQYKQEILGDFVSIGGNKAVWNFDRNKHIKEPVDMPPVLYAGCDFNVSMMATTIFGVISDTVVVVDELYLENSNTEAMAKYIKQKYPQIKDTFPDPAGKARSTTAKNNHSDHMILKQHGFNVFARPKAPHVKQRLYDLNRLLLDAEDNVRLTVSPKCEKLIRDFELCQRKPDGSLDKTDLSLTHFLDSLTYYLNLKHSSYVKNINYAEF